MLCVKVVHVYNMHVQTVLNSYIGHRLTPHHLVILQIARYVVSAAFDALATRICTVIRLPLSTLT